MDIDKIFAQNMANEYAQKKHSKVVALKKLDNKAKLPPTIFTYSFGLLAAFLAGLGMCLSMKVIGSGAFPATVFGIIIGIIGFFLMGINYPLYKKFMEKQKEKYAFEIIELAKEICGE